MAEVEAGFVDSIDSHCTNFLHCILRPDPGRWFMFLGQGHIKGAGCRGANKMPPPKNSGSPAPKLDLWMRTFFFTQIMSTKEYWEEINKKCIQILWTLNQGFVWDEWSAELHDVADAALRRHSLHCLHQQPQVRACMRSIYFLYKTIYTFPLNKTISPIY